MKINSKISSVKEIFDGKSHYIVPSSHDKIYDTLWGNFRYMLESITQNYQIGEEQCFAGTIILSGKNEILDGSLNLQLLSIFLKELSFLFPDSEELKSLTFNWLETKVSNLEQESLLKYFSSKSSDETDEQDESFGEISMMLRKDRSFSDLFKGENRIDPESFIGYILNNVVFNVVKNTENSQWDLFYMSNPLKPVENLSDIFCESLIEYLTDVKGMSEKEAAEKVFDLYLYSLEADKKVIDLYNFSAKEDLYPDEIETIKKRCYTEKSWKGFDRYLIIKKYQIILIRKYRLSSSLLWEDESVFFRKLFASLLKKEKTVPEEFKGVELDLDEIKRIIDITFDLVKIYKTDMCSKTEKILFRIARETRYKEYVDSYKYFISTPYLFFNEGDIEGMKKVLVELYKLFFVYDIYTSNTSEVDSFMGDFRQNINKSCDELLEKISCKKNEIDMELLKKKLLHPYGKDEEERMSRIKEVCHLFEFLKMKDQDKFDLKDLTSSYSDNYSLILIQDVFKTRIWNWNLKESIGNMALVERKISQKVTQRTSFLERKKIFKKSKLYTSHLISRKKDWTEEDAQKRTDEMTEEITKFLFSDLTKSQKEA